MNQKINPSYIPRGKESQTIYEAKKDAMIGNGGAEYIAAMRVEDLVSRLGITDSEAEEMIRHAQYACSFGIDSILPEV